ncbi:uncharacterized protein LOC135221171 [Macrobrachium nipponense]|uniref:uncharacterized protein LOC135221171 n=1 Tax=Macrobrachium nipponense TaxID=159736 RepID=UPI0030C899DF
MFKDKQEKDRIYVNRIGWRPANHNQIRGRKHQKGPLIQVPCSVIDNEGNMEEEINNRIQCGWNNWRKVSSVICDSKVPIRLMGRVHKAEVRPAMTFGFWIRSSTTKENRGQQVGRSRDEDIRWMSGVTKLDRVRNEYIRGTLMITEASKKVEEAKLKWYGHMMRRGE